MDALALNCPNCGAAATPEATQCAFCRARLATVACPSCFGLVFVGSRHCSHCGARASRGTTLDVAPRRCPRCRNDFSRIALGETELSECDYCNGVWADADTFQRLCADNERQAVVLSLWHTPHGVVAAGRVRYLPCPQCGKVMNRLNFARSSGIVLDVCKWHGVWFEEHELRRVVEFIRRGGLEAARAYERAALAEARRLLEHRQAMWGTNPQPRRERPTPDYGGDIIADFLSLFGS